MCIEHNGRHFADGTVKYMFPVELVSIFLYSNFVSKGLLTTIFMKYGVVVNALASFPYSDNANATVVTHYMSWWVLNWIILYWPRVMPSITWIWKKALHARVLRTFFVYIITYPEWYFKNYSGAFFVKTKSFKSNEVSHFLTHLTSIMVVARRNALHNNMDK